MIDNIKPPTPPKAVIVAFEMMSPVLADWLLNLDILTRETILFEAYIQYNLGKEETR